MQSENGILLLFYIFLSHGNEKKWKKGDAVSCPQVPVMVGCIKYICLYQIKNLNDDKKN
jgi:hypothetical protein